MMTLKAVRIYVVLTFRGNRRPAYEDFVSFSIYEPDSKQTQGTAERLERQEERCCSIDKHRSGWSNVVGNQ